MKKNMTRITTLILSLCMAASLLCLSAGAADTTTKAKTFSDVSDRGTSVAVESLRLMGVLDGYQDGSFRPDATLTRAQFCKMAVYAMNGSSELGKYRLTTVFPDVKPSYWAAGYINMASKGKSIISGYPNGTFQPERKVTVGQAVTILMRQLGYKDTDMGGVWPEGSMTAAANIGLTDGVSNDGYAALTRGQAAKLFLNLLRADCQDGTAYASTLKLTTVSNVMIVSSTATGSDGQNTAMQAGSGVTYQMANTLSNGVLNGYKGTLLLNKQSKVVTFIPDSMGSSKTVVVSKAETTRLTDTSGAQYSIQSTTDTFYNSTEKTWGDVCALLNPGISVTLYFGSTGGVEYVFVGGGSVANSAVVAYANGSTSGFSSLTGGSTNYKIYKDGVPASATDIRAYDVATYAGATGTIRLCDVRISGCYENCTPNASSPTSVTVMGHTFNVLPSAVETLSKFTIGQQITLLLTEDNQVAGAVESSKAAGNAMGIVRSVSTSEATVDLLCGITVSGKTQLGAGDASSLNGQLVRVASTKGGYIGLSQLSGGPSGDLNTVKKMVGSVALSDNVMVFEKSASGVKATTLAALNNATIPSSQVVYAGTDWANRVNILVVMTSSASEYIIGLVEYSYGSGTQLSIKTPSQTYGPYSTAYRPSSGGFAGIKLDDDGDIGRLLELSTVLNVPNSAWNGESTITISSRTYTVAGDAICYNASTSSWMTLAQARAFAKTSTIYVDDYGIVRAVMVR
jgi:hypothetical protein